MWGVTSLTIGNSVTSIGARAFEGMSGVTSLSASAEVFQKICAVQSGKCYFSQVVCDASANHRCE